jgi:hypothetical protein
MIGVAELARVASDWSAPDYFAWLTEGLSDLAAKTKAGVPFAPLVLRPSDEPLGQVHTALRRAAPRIRLGVQAAVQDLLAALSPDNAPKYCDLAWRLAAGLRPSGGLIAEARHLIAFPTIDAEDPEWRDCLRSMLRALLSYAKTRELVEFMDDFHRHPLWQTEFAWTYGMYLVRREPRQWLAFIEEFGPDLECDRTLAPRGYLRRLRRLTEAADAAQIARHYETLRTDRRFTFLYADLVREPNPIIEISERGDVLIVIVGQNFAEITLSRLDGKSAEVMGRDEEGSLIAELYAQVLRNRRSPEHADSALARLGAQARSINRSLSLH